MQKLCAQSLDGFLIQSGQPTGKCRTRWEALTRKQSEKFLCKRRKTIIKGRKSWFTADGIGEQDDDEINRVIHTKAGSGKLNLLLNSGNYSSFFEYITPCRHLFRACCSSRGYT